MGPIRDLEALFETAGGAINIAVKLKLHQLTVERWRRHGIPQKWWTQLIKAYELSPELLHSINQRVRERRNAR